MMILVVDVGLVNTKNEATKAFREERTDRCEYRVLVAD